MVHELLAAHRQAAVALLTGHEYSRHWPKLGELWDVVRKDFSKDS